MVTVPILDDSVVEDTEFINLALTSEDNAVILNPPTARIDIKDVDSEFTKLMETACTFVFPVLLIISSGIHRRVGVCIIVTSSLNSQRSFSGFQSHLHKWKKVTIFTSYFLLQMSQLDTMEPILCMKMLEALASLYLF